MLFDEALAYLLSLGHETLNIKLGLKNTEVLLEALGNPHKDFPVVQIVGTNGKGSIAMMLESICRAAGVRVGLFNSPHLGSIAERIRVNGEQVSDADFAQFLGVVKEVAAELLRQRRLDSLPSVFEHVTVTALLTFRAARVDLAILEAGLGGCRDSTSAAEAQIVALTPIALDHEEYLGQSVADIAAEKAAIIQPGVTAIVAPQSEAARAVILRQCHRSQVVPKLITPAAENVVSPSADGHISFSLETERGNYDVLRLGLRGRHQFANAATAIALAETLGERGFAISPDAIVSGLESATHPGRLEVWAGEPQMLFDGAHNPAAARALREYLDEFVAAPITMIFAAMRDKALNEMTAILFPAALELILTQIENPRAASIELMQSILPQSLDSRIHCASSVADALRIATEVTPPDGLVCVTGSLYLIGEVQQSVREGLDAQESRKLGAL
jgi:dihydrofolate synthase/folylpolyglutamate synthase